MTYLPRFSHLLASALVFAGTCSANAETVLRFATTLPEQVTIVSEFLAPWAQKVTESSNGELKIEVLNGPTIANARNVYERVLSGVVDIAWATHGALPVGFPKTSVSTLPFVVEDAITGSEALWTLYENGLLDGEYDMIAPLALVATPPAGFHSTKPVNTIADMEGTKVRVSDRVASQAIEALGAAPIALTPPELYQGVSQGVVESVHTPYTGLVTFRLDEITSDHLDVDFGSLPGLIFINRSVYESLPPAARKALDDNSGLSLSHDFAKWFDDFNTAGHAKVETMDGHTIHTLSDEETGKWKAAVQPVVDAWIAETPGGAEILETFRSSMQE
jgi:TRAP-type C4-dicarboxylate transport system substrate-binding protein